MNNLTFGNEFFSHYETIGGGSGAALGHEGTSAVQVHMTNTAITDPEILESRFPVRLTGFRKRTGSGGKGSWNGGEGIERHAQPQEVKVGRRCTNRIAPPRTGATCSLQKPFFVSVSHLRESHAPRNACWSFA